MIQNKRKQNLYLISGILLALCLSLGVFYGVLYFIRQNERTLYNAKTVIPQPQVITIEALELTDIWTETENVLLQLHDSNANLRAHDPAEGQMTMEEAAAHANSLVRYFAEQIPELQLADVTENTPFKASLAGAFDSANRLIGQNNSVWTVVLQQESVQVTLIFNAYTKMLYYMNVWRGTPGQYTMDLDNAVTAYHYLLGLGDPVYTHYTDAAVICQFSHTLLRTVATAQALSDGVQFVLELTI